MLLHIGIVHERMGKYAAARAVYDHILEGCPDDPVTLQQQGWLLLQDSAFCNTDRALAILLRVVELDPTDAFSWYLVGRGYMTHKLYNKAYESYQHAVRRDSRNPSFWFSIGYLYQQTHQHRDALDAYIRAIHINSRMVEVWWNLGILYESCNNQAGDALDAYQRVLELDPTNKALEERIHLMKQTSDQSQSSQPVAELATTDIHPSTYPSQMPGLIVSPEGLEQSCLRNSPRQLQRRQGHVGNA